MVHIISAHKNELMCDLLKFKLSAAGHRVQIVTDGQKAFKGKQLRRTHNAAELARISGPAIKENFGYRQINFVFRLLGMWQCFRKVNSWASVPRIGFIRSDESKTVWPLTVERRLKQADLDITEVTIPPAPAAVDHKLKRSNHG